MCNFNKKLKIKTGKTVTSSSKHFTLQTIKRKKNIYNFLYIRKNYNKTLNI